MTTCCQPSISSVSMTSSEREDRQHALYLENAGITRIGLQSLMLIFIIFSIASTVIVNSITLTPPVVEGLTYLSFSGFIISLFVLPIALAVNECVLIRAFRSPERES